MGRAVHRLHLEAGRYDRMRVSEAPGMYSSTAAVTLDKHAAVQNGLLHLVHNPIICSLSACGVQQSGNQRTQAFRSF